MKYFGVCPGTCGEFIQGMMGDREYLVSYGIDMYSKAVLEEKKSNIRKGPKKSRDALEKLFEIFGEDRRHLDNISLEIKSEIPVGKGMASSTSDIGATLGAGLSLLGKSMSGEEISKLACQIEATDSIYLKNCAIFDPLSGSVKEELGYIDGMKVLVLEPQERLSTMLLRSREDYYKIKMENRPLHEEAFEMIRDGFSKNDMKLLANACTISGRLNQRIHQKEGFEEILKASEKYGALGLNVAHSGTVIGVLMEKDMDEKRLVDRLVEKDIHKKYKNMYALNIIRGGIKKGKLNPNEILKRVSI